VDDPEVGLHPDTVMREVTNTGWSSGFLAALTVWGGIVLYAVASGNPIKFQGLPSSTKTDGETDYCGYGAMENRSFLYFCPSRSAGTGAQSDFSDVRPLWSKTTCVEHCNDLVEARSRCAALAIDGFEVLWPALEAAGYEAAPAKQMFCLPEAKSDQAMMRSFSARFAGEAMSLIFHDAPARLLIAAEDLVRGWKLLLVSAAASVFVGATYFKYARSCAETLLRLGLNVLALACLVTGLRMMIDSQQIPADSKNFALKLLIKLLPGDGLAGGPDGLAHTEDSLHHFMTGMCLTVVAMVIACILCRTWRSVINACHCITCATECVRDIPEMVAEPLFAVVIKAAILGGWLAGAVFLASAEGGFEVTPRGIEVHQSLLLKLLMVVYIFGLFWLLELSRAVSAFALAYSTELWYFSRRASGGVCTGYRLAIRYHLGSLAFGSLVIPLARIPRFIAMATAELKAKGNNKCLDMFWPIVDGIVSCYERVLNQVSRAAYMEVALTGSNFSSACKQSLATLSNPATTVWTMTGTTMLLELSGAGLAAATGAATAYWGATGGLDLDGCRGRRGSASRSPRRAWPRRCSSPPWRASSAGPWRCHTPSRTAPWPTRSCFASPPRRCHRLLLGHTPRLRTCSKIAVRADTAAS